MKKMNRNTKEMIGGCCVCSDERGWSENPLVYCDGHGCNVAVHQACYGIVQVPTGPWFCKKCESQERIARVKCELCPQRDGALKRTKSGGWCHVVCALYVPEACFDNVQTMEPIVLSSVPHERFNKTCYICEEQRRDTKATAGACMQCNKNGCKQYFHVTCAQAQGLLCEVTSSYENVKYCGYCAHHYKKLKNLSNVKTIPAFRPIPNDNETPDSSPEKNPPVISDDGKKKPKPDPSVETAVKSPQVDQSVSSTSDSLPPTLVASVKPDPTLPSSSTSLSGNSSEMSDNITSAVSPSQTEDSKNLPNDQQIQEPSSSMITTVSKSSQSHPTDLIIQDGSATSSTENLFDVDVISSPPPPLEKAEQHATLKKPLMKKSKVKLDNGPKKQRLGSSDKPMKRIGKKSKHNVTSTSTSNGNNNGGKDSTKKQSGVSKKTRHHSGSNTKLTSSASSTSKSSTLQVNTTLPWHHDYCSGSSSNNVFGGSPYFQSLSAPGHVSLPSFSSSSVFLANLPNSSGITNSLYGDGNRQQQCDPPEAKVGMSNLVPPLKVFPNPFQDTASKNNFPLTMEHLLEQQWEAGAHFLMEQSEHFDISSLLNCLHHYKTDIRQLEDEVRDLTSQRDHLMAINARLSVPLSMLDSSSLAKTNSNWASLEDISSPDEVVEKPSFVPSLNLSESTMCGVEDVVSPSENVQASSSRSRFAFTDQMYPAPQSMVHSVLNPPPSTLARSTATSSLPIPSSLSSPNLSSFKTSFIPIVPPVVPATTSASSTSSSLPSSNPSMPLLEPSLNNLHLSNHI